MADLAKVEDLLSAERRSGRFVSPRLPMDKRAKSVKFVFPMALTEKLRAGWSFVATIYGRQGEKVIELNPGGQRFAGGDSRMKEEYVPALGVSNPTLGALDEVWIEFRAEAAVEFAVGATLSDYDERAALLGALGLR